MAKDKVGKTLSSLSEVDKQIAQFVNRRTNIANQESSIKEEMIQVDSRLDELTVLLKDAEEKHSAEESRLKEEEEKIIERRKQLTTIGGAKSAKLVERELDIATRTLEELEKAATEAFEELDNVKAQMADISDRKSSLVQGLEELTTETGPELEEIQKNVTKLTKQRDTQLKKLEPRLQGLYSRVNERYPGEAVAKAAEGSCQSCYRFLPQQRYNQIMAGNLLIQCPGCSRILVYGLD